MSTPYMVRKARNHPAYQSLLRESSASTLRKQVRKIGVKRWYCLKKMELTSMAIIHQSAVTVTNFFRDIVDAKILRAFESHAAAGSQCPISLSPIAEMDFHQTFVHGGFVFSKQAIKEYVGISIDFVNPITRTAMHLHEVKRMGCPFVLNKYIDRDTLRKKQVGAIQHFSFLEGELENITTRLFRLVYHYGNTEDFDRAIADFEKTWRAMKKLDRNRTICVLKSLEQLAERFGNKPRIWGITFLRSFLDKT